MAELNQQFNAELQRQVAQAQEQARQELEQRSQDAQVWVSGLRCVKTKHTQELLYKDELQVSSSFNSPVPQM